MDKLLVVQVSRNGGVAGIPRTGFLEFDTQVPSPKDESLLRLALGALEQLRGPQHASENSLARDAFTWILTFNGEEHLVPDSRLTGPARELAEQVLRVPRRRNSERAGPNEK